MLLLVNSYVSVIGVLFATIWVSGGKYVRRQNLGHSFETSLRFTPWERRAFGTTHQAVSGLDTVQEWKRPTAELSKTDVNSHEFALTGETGIPSGPCPYSKYSTSNIEVLVMQDVEQV